MTLAIDTPGSTASAAAALARRHRLMFRFILFNMAAVALLIATYVRGWIDLVLAADASHLCVVIFVVFLFGMAAVAAKIWRVNQELNSLDIGRPAPGGWAAGYLAETAGRSEHSRTITGASLRLRLASWIAVVRHIANSLVLLGLIGTVIGFVIALSGVDPSTAGDIASITPMVARLIGGMAVALYTTLVGAVLNIWLMANFHMLSGGVVRLATGIVAAGEADAGS